MPRQLVECVPNFSEGRDRAVIDAISGAIQSVTGISLLDVDPGADTNRTVITFVVLPKLPWKLPFADEDGDREDRHATSSRRASRLGSADVTPFVPLSGMTMDKCVELARKLGSELATSCVFLSISMKQLPAPKLVALCQHPHGEYEGLAAKLLEPAWQPDLAL